MKVYWIEMVKRIIVCLILTICCMSGYATSPDTLASRLDYQTYIYPQEKVYIATDKNVYVAGDSIRFRAFLVDALKLTQQKDGSKYVYVEIIDPFGNKISKIKVKEKNGMFAGIVPLSEEMPEGTYTLGAYTLFMKNQGEDFIFRKPLPILSQMAKKYKMKTKFDGNILQTSLSEHFSEKPARAFGVSLHSKDEVLSDNVKHRSNVNFSLNSKALKEDVLKVKYDLYEKFVRIPKDTSSFVVTFHPEGGYMIPGVAKKIAFKALGNDGLSTDVQGEIVTSQGEKVCDIKSGHKGMGSIELVPKRGETYSARIRGKIFELPVANTETSTLSILKMVLIS